jgi:hypothetical protein
MSEIGMDSDGEVSMAKTTFYAKSSSSPFAACRSRVAKPSGEPGVERGEDGAGGVALALALPEPCQAGGGAQLEGLGLLPPGDLEGVVEKRLRLLNRVAVSVEENLSP